MKLIFAVWLHYVFVSLFLALRNKQLVDVSKEIVLAFWSDSPVERSELYLAW